MCINKNTTQYVFEKHSKYKTELCSKYLEKGYCPYGKYCKFAHGTYELRVRVPKNVYYKTQPCFQFFHNGYCPYGTRCHFSHSLLIKTHSPLPIFKQFHNYSYIQYIYKKMIVYLYILVIYYCIYFT